MFIHLTMCGIEQFFIKFCQISIFKQSYSVIFVQQSTGTPVTLFLTILLQEELLDRVIPYEKLILYPEKTFSNTKFLVYISSFGLNPAGLLLCISMKETSNFSKLANHLDMLCLSFIISIA